MVVKGWGLPAAAKQTSLIFKAQKIPKIIPKNLFSIKIG
jgi:hypothetical protein